MNTHSKPAAINLSCIFVIRDLHKKPLPNYAVPLWRDKSVFILILFLDKIGNVRINVTPRRVFEAFVTVEKQ